MTYSENRTLALELIDDLPPDLAVVTSHPPLFDGRSKRVWQLDDRSCLVVLKPTLSSFTFGRDAVIPETGPLRLDFYERAASKLAERGIRTVFQERVGRSSYRAELCPSPPFEVIVKNYAFGSTLRKYPGLFSEGEQFPRPIVKFDYRTEPEDQPIGEDYLRMIGRPVDEWRAIALEVNSSLQEWLAPRVLIDFCIIIGSDAQGRQVINSEVSPDGMRLRSPSGHSLDKDLFRKGETPESIIATWADLVRSLD